MIQLTIRGFSPELEKAIRATAKNRGLSMNKAALYLMRRGAGLRSPDEESLVIGDALDAYFGSMSQEDADNVQIAVEALDEVTDGDIWK